MQEVNIVNEKNVACSTSKQRMLQPLNHHIIASRKTVSPEGIQHRNRLPSLRQPPKMHLEETQDGKGQDIGLR